MPVTLPSHLYRSLRVYLLDDHEIVRRGLEDLLERKRDITVVGQGGYATLAAPAIIRLRPDVMVLDIHLRDGSGIAVCRQVRAKEPSVRGLLLTSDDDDEALLSAVVARAHGHVLKELSTCRLIDAIRRVGSGEQILDPSKTQPLLDRLTAVYHSEGGLAAEDRTALGHLLQELAEAGNGSVPESSDALSPSKAALLVPTLIHELRQQPRSTRT